MHYRIVQYSIIAICFSILLIFNSEKLILYIHPRYLLFTISFVIVAIILLISDLILNKKDYKISKSGWIVVFVAFISLLIPPQSLTSEIAINRIGQKQISNSINKQSSYDSFSTDLTRFTILEWSNLLNSNPNESQIIGKNAKLTGFIIKDDSNQNYIARYKLTCCAVDATPITVPIYSDSKELANGQWVEIQGIITKTESINNPLQLNITDLKNINEPDRPYVY